MQTAPMTIDQNKMTLRPVDKLKNALNHPAVQDQFKQALAGQSGVFISSLIELFTSDKYLQDCEPKAVIMEALKAATLKLPINKGLGFAWVIARYSGKDKRMIPAFQIGWKGVVQLAQRTMQYASINCGPVYDGELKSIDKLSGEIDLNGEKKNDEIIGFFAYFKLLSGFHKTSYWTKQQVINHALKYNQESKKAGKLTGNWSEHFESRAMSTVLKHLLLKYGVLSIEMVNAVSDGDDGYSAQDEIDEFANTGDFIDITPEPEKAIGKTETAPVTETEAPF